jgi:conjugative transposon protein TcpC
VSRESHSKKLNVPARASGRTLARTIGRGAIWATVALLLVRGVGSVLTPTSEPVARAGRDGSAEDLATDAFAVRFARSFLADPSASSLAPYLAEGVRVGSGLGPKVETAAVAQAEVSSTEDLGGGESVVTVACELRDARTLYLAVPIARSAVGEVAALGAPWLVAGPGTAAGAEDDRPQPIAGPDAPEIESLISKFLPAYLASSDAGELSYLLLPGVDLQPLGGQVEVKELTTVAQLGDGEGPRRTVAAAVRVTDPTGEATYPLVYRLSVERVGAGDRWYVSGVEGVSA